MHAVADALQTVLSHCRPLPAALTPLSPAALGQALAEEVCSDVDVPPFDKAVMDGYAVRSGDLSSGVAELSVLGTAPGRSADTMNSTVPAPV